jgi:ATP-dependent RNA helicase DDX56/DBP9
MEDIHFSVLLQMSVRFAEPDINKDEDQLESDEEIVSRSFYDFGLDNRLLKSIADLQWATPTPIQAETIPYALLGKDLLVKARTGSGKTGVYAIAAIQHLLTKPMTASAHVRILVLSPTKELCHQIATVLSNLTSYCRRDINLYDLSNSLATQIQKQSLLSNSHALPDIIISTPMKLLEHLKDHTSPINLNHLELFILDEADILYSLGCANDMKKLAKYLPSKSKSYQCFLISATLNDDILQLKQLFLHNPVKINQSDDYSTILPDTKQLLQYYIYCEHEQKFILIITILKLRLLIGRTILFVNSVEQAYRLKLLMEQFHLKTCLLNSELPMDSRLHIVQQYVSIRFITVDYKTNERQ